MKHETETQPVEFEKLSSLKGYHYKFMSYGGYDFGLSTVRAYKPGNSEEYYDIKFFSTRFVQLLSHWEDLAVCDASFNEKEKICHGLPADFCASHRLFRFGSENSGLYVLASDVGGISSLMTNKFEQNPTEYIGNQDSPNIYKVTDALEATRSREYYYYVASYNPEQFMLQISAIGIGKPSNRYLLNFKRVEYLQISSEWNGTSFVIADDDEKEMQLKKSSIEPKANLLLLKSNTDRMQVYIVCRDIQIVSH